MIIYNKLGVQVADVDVSDDSYRHKAIMGENSLTLYFSLPEYAEIPVGSYCEFKGERYTLILPENLKRHGKRNLEYTLVLESEQYLLTKYKVRNLSDKRLKFPFTAKPIEHLQLIVDILNLKSGGWSIGECIDAVEKEIVYSHTYLNEALKLQAETFETEYEIVGKSISLKKVEYNKEAPLELSYGHGNGFEPGCGRSNYENTVPVEVLFVQGGDKNVDFSKYGSKQLLLPKSQSLVYEGRTYVTDADGLFVTRGDKAQSTGQEDSLDCSHIFPSRVGTVTSVDIVSEEGNLYDILDNTIPAALDYSLCRIAGEKATIRFESGMLAGKEFDLVQSESAFSGYVHADRRFKIVPQEIDGQIMPNDTFSPSVGDKYAIFGIQLPDAYFRNDATKTGASWDMFREGAKYLFEHEDPRFSFTGQLNGIWSKTNWLAIGGKIKLGGYVAFTDVDFQTVSALVRIIDINEYVNSPYEPKIELSNVAVGGSTLSSELKKLSAEEVITEGRFRESLQFTKRRFRDAQETMTLLSQSLLNFSGSVSPITVQTMALLVGDESLQFRFVNSKTVPDAANHVIEFNNATKVLSAAPGILQHMTVGIKTISQSHLASEYRYWDMAAYDSPPLTEANASKAYYLYAKCANQGTAGVFVLSDVAIGMTSVAGYYHFLVGILNSENASERSYVSLYGFSEILPGRITTDKIVSPDGRLTIDLSSNPPKITALDGAIIEGKVQFQAGSSGLAQLAEWPTAAQDIQDAAAAAAEAERKAVEAQEKLANDIDPKLAKMQEQIDGEVSNYYLPYSPTLSNYPASEWLTAIEKEAHLGDTFNNNLQFISDIETPDAGKFWRWTKSGTDYFWNQISDSDSVLALKKAAEAKGVADGKSTHYLIQPTAYKFGDSWVCDIVGDAEKGSMLFATQDSNVFNRAHWVKKDKYTDDTAVNNLQVGGVNLLENSIYPLVQERWLYIDKKLKDDEIITVQIWCEGTGILLCYCDVGYSFGGTINTVNGYGKLTYSVKPWTFNQYSNGIVLLIATGTNVKIKVERGNKGTDHTLAPEDVAADATAKAATAQAAAEAYALAKANLAEVTAKAYADGIVTEEEVRAIADATAKANAAQAAAISAATTDATAKASAAQTAAQEYALAKANLAEVTAKAYADGIVTDEEVRAIADATTKANAAQSAAISAAAADATAKVNAVQIGGRNLIQGSDYTTNIQAWIDPITVQSDGDIKFVRKGYGWDFRQIILLEPGVYTWSGLFRATSDNALARASYANGEVYLPGISTGWSFKYVTFEVATSSQGFNFLEANNSGVLIDFARMKIEKGNKPTDWNLAFGDLMADATAKAATAQAAAEAYALAKANLAEVTAKAYADGIVTEEEVRAMADATAKANAAQSAAIASAAADATAKANAIQVGGRNLMPNPSYGSLSDSWLFISNVLKDYEIITVQMWCTGNGHINCYPDNGYGPVAFLDATNGYGKVTYAVKPWTYGQYSNGSVLFIATGTNVKIKVERGNKPTDFSDPPELTEGKIADAKNAGIAAAAAVAELNYLKTALAGTTEVAGGLILARMMMLKNALNQVTAGISGMDSNDIFLFANDTDALNAALNNMATFLLRRNGTGNLGTLKFTRNGLAYCTRNADGTLGKAIIEFRNTPIPPLSDLVASFTDTKAAPGGNATKMGGVLTGNFGYGVPIIVSTYDNFSMRITGTLEASINNVGDMPILDSHAAINLVLYKYDGGVYTVEQNVSFLYLLKDVVGTDSDSIAVDETYTLAKGTYYLRAEYYINTSEGSHDSGFVSAANLQMVASGASGNQTMIFGSNGFVRVKDGNNFTYMSDEMMAHRGVSDMPGFRSTANISASGILTNIFGLNIGLELLGTGLYKITHNIGHMNYTEHLTIVNTEARLNAVVSEKAINYFTVKIVNVATNTLTNSAFEVSINSNG